MLRNNYNRASAIPSLAVSNEVLCSNNIEKGHKQSIIHRINISNIKQTLLLTQVMYSCWRTD